MNRRKFIYRGIFSASAVAAALGASAATLENDRVRVEIGGKGELKALVCKATGHDWAGGAPLWRLYFDDKRGGHEEKEVPVIGAEQTPTIRVVGVGGGVGGGRKAIVLDYPSLVCRGKPFDASLKLTVTLEDDGLVRFASELSSREAHTCIRELHYPLVGDCRLPKDAELLTTFLGGERFKDPIGKIAREGNEPPYFGRTWEFRQIDYKYPSHTVANCFAFLNDTEGLYIASHDPTLQDTWHGLRAYPDKPMSFTRLETGLYKYPDVRCGETWRNDSNVLCPYAGDWKVTARLYRKWANTWWKRRAAPAWVNEMTGWQRIAFRHQYGVTYYTPKDVAGQVWEAGHKAGIDTLLCFGWWNVGMDNGYPDSYFTTDPETGGDAAWKKAIADFQSKGGRFHLYFNGKLIDLESDYFRNGPGKDVCYRDNTGAVYTEQYRFKGTGTFTGYYNTRTFTPANQRSETWRALLRKMVDRAIDFGADSVFFDQLGYCEYTSTWKTGGEFPMPDHFIIAEKAKTLKMLHDYMDEKAPKDFAIGTECFVDACVQHVDYVHNLINPSKPTDFSDWMRYAFPEVPVTDREIRDDTDVAWRVNHNLLLGLRTDGETFRCQRTLDWAPAHQKRLGQINALRRKYPALMGTYRDTDGLENTNPKTLLARAFADGDRMAVVVCTAKDVPAEGVVSVPGRRLASWDGIDAPHVEKAAGGAKVSLPANALVVLDFAKESSFGVTHEKNAHVVKTGAVTFFLPDDGPLAVPTDNRRSRVFSFNLRVSGSKGKVGASPVFSKDAVTVVANTPERIVLRADRAMNSWEGPFDAARLVTDYVFAKDVPGVILVHRLVAKKPFTFFSWNAPVGFEFARYSIDGREFATYPTRAEFKAKPGAYGTKAGAYILGETPKGEQWFMGREFATFCPGRDGHPGSFYASSDSPAARQGRSVAAGEVITLSASLGRILRTEDVARLRAFRLGDGLLPVPEWSGSWDSLPEVAWRGETKDYRPRAGLNWNGKTDLSFGAKLAQDASGIRARVEVTDDLVRNAFSGKDAALGDSVEFVFADAAGKRELARLVPATGATRTPDGYVAEIAVGWDELAAAGLDRKAGIRFNACVTDQDKGNDYENWMGIADGIKGGRDLSLFPTLDLAGVRTTLARERPVLPDHASLQKKIDAVKAAKGAIEAAGVPEDDYTSCLLAMTDYFLDFMQTDLDAKDFVMMSHQKRMIDDEYRYYMDARINSNAEDLLAILKELAARQADLKAGRAKPVVLPKLPKGVRPVISDGGFKVAGRELLLIGPDIWPNVKGFRNSDIDWVSRTGFNLFSCFYVGGTNYFDLVRRCEEGNLYCAWGSVQDPQWKHPPSAFTWSEKRQNEHKNGVGYWMGSMIPTNPSPNFAYQIALGEQWCRTEESTAPWAAGFQAHLKEKFGSLENLNAALGASYGDWTNLTFAAALKDVPLKYESFVYRMDRNMAGIRPCLDYVRTRYSLPCSLHYSTHYNIVGLDPLVVLADFEKAWEAFDVIGFDGGFGLEGSEWAMDFPKGGFEYDFARSCHPTKPVANNENHVVDDGTYYEHSNEETYLSNILAFLMGQNASLVWDWANTRHTFGEYVFTRANMYREVIRCALDLRCHAEEIAAFRRCPNPPFRIFHSLPSFGERDPYVRSLYGLYGACSFTGWANRFITERDLEKGDFRGAKVIVVPDARRVSDATFAAFAAFARQGGIVLVDGEEALTKDVWGKPVPSRTKALKSFRRFADAGSRTRFETLNAALAEKSCRFADLRPSTFNLQPCFGVMWRTARTAAGENVAFVANLAKTSAEVDIPVGWREVRDGRAVSGRVTLKPLDLLILENPTHPPTCEP